MSYMDNTTASYDILAKRILSRKVILARILKSCVAEFENCTLDDIMNKYIEGDPTATIDTVPLDDILDIRGRNTEFNSPNEKTVKLDIIFDAITPSTGDPIRIIINVEPQKTDHVDYYVIKRAIYYAARLISSQKEKIFTGDDYNKIRKVYTIWVVMDVHKDRRNSIQRFKVTEELLHGTFHEDIKNYDLMTIVLLNLGYGTMSHDLLKMLHLIFLDMLKTEEKETILLDEYGIKLTRDMRKEIEDMSGLMEPAVKFAAMKAAEEAAAKVEKETRESTTLVSIRNLMKNMKWSAQQAMEALGIPVNEQSKYAALI